MKFDISTEPVQHDYRKFSFIFTFTILKFDKPLSFWREEVPLYAEFETLDVYEIINEFRKLS